LHFELEFTAPFIRNYHLTRGALPQINKDLMRFAQFNRYPDASCYQCDQNIYGEKFENNESIIAAAGDFLNISSAVSPRERPFAFVSADLHQAASRGNIDLISVLLRHGAKINVRAVDGQTALFYVDSVHCDVIKVFAGAGADINMQDKSGLTALHKAASRDPDNIDLVKELLSHGADVNIQDKYGQIALHYAAHYGHLNIVKELLINGADINIQDKGGQTALHKAARCWDLETVKELLSKGADANIKDEYGKMAFDKGSSSEIRRLIAKHMKHVGWKQWLKCYLI
jgi:ankyrin repeat protein